MKSKNSKILIIGPSVDNQIPLGPITVARNLLNQLNEKYEIDYISKENLTIKSYLKTFHTNYTSILIHSWNLFPFLFLFLFLFKSKIIFILHGEMGLELGNGIKKKMLIILERILINYSNKVVIVSKLFKKVIINKYKKVPQNKFIVIKNGIDYKRVEFIKKRNENKTRVIFPGGKREIKGYFFLMSALKEISVKKEIFLYIIGNDKLKKYKLGKNIFIIELPFQTQSKYFNILEKCDIFILPSKFDTFGISVLEAMQVNLKIIISDMVGIKDYVEDLEVIKTGSISELNMALKRLIFEKRKVDFSSQLDKFRWSGIANQYVHLIEGLKEK